LATTTYFRPRLSTEFIRENQRKRLLTGFSHCIVKQGYRAVTVADIVRETGVARNTFYDNFTSKDALAAALLQAVCPELEVEGGIHADSAMVLAVELAAPLRLGDAEKLNRAMAEGWNVVGEAVEFVSAPLPVVDESDPEQAKLPPGRHGLDRDFVLRNQLQRLLDGTARAVHAYGFSATTIADITRHAAVSRRTFYEHFDGKHAAVTRMVGHAVETFGAPVFPQLLDSGLGSLWAEIVAAQLCGHRTHAEERRQSGEDVLGALDAVS
jgi:AcrR family transcriptional regulator